MVRLNARARLERVPEAQVAAEFLSRKLGLQAETRVDSLASAGVAAHA